MYLDMNNKVTYCTIITENLELYYIKWALDNILEFSFWLNFILITLKAIANLHYKKKI